MIVIMFATAMMLAMMIFTALALHNEITRNQSAHAMRNPVPFGVTRGGR